MDEMDDKEKESMDKSAKDKDTKLRLIIMKLMNKKWLIFWKKDTSFRFYVCHTIGLIFVKLHTLTEKYIEIVKFEPKTNTITYLTYKILFDLSDKKSSH